MIELNANLAVPFLPFDRRREERRGELLGRFDGPAVSEHDRAQVFSNEGQAPIFSLALVDEQTKEFSVFHTGI